MKITELIGRWIEKKINLIFAWLSYANTAAWYGITMHIYLFSEAHISSLSSPRAAQCCVQKNVTQHSAADNQTEYNFDNSCLVGLMFYGI